VPFGTMLRRRDPAIVGRVEDGRLRLDLRAVPAGRDGDIYDAVIATAATATAADTNADGDAASL